MQKPRLSLSLSLATLPALLLLVVMGMPLLAETPPPAATHDIYNPAHTALVNAQRQLAESSRQQQEISERLQRMHAEIDSSLELLKSARELDPAMKASIETISNRLS